MAEIFTIIGATGAATAIAGLAHKYWKENIEQQ